MSEKTKERMEIDTGREVFLDSDEPNRPLSRYNQIRFLLNQNNIPVQESWHPPEIKEQSTDRYFEVTIDFAHRPDLISYMYYGTMQLYWVIALANDMIDPIAETSVGKRLRIPDRDYIFQEILFR